MNPLAIACPTCGAAPGEGCTDWRTGDLRGITHAARDLALAERNRDSRTIR